MKRSTLIALLWILWTASVGAQNAISLDEAVPSSDGRITAGDTVEFRLRVQIDTSQQGGLWAYTNGFRVYSPDGAVWSTTYGQYLPAWLPFGERGVSHSGIDGIGADTVLFGGEDSAGGFWVVYDDVAWSIKIEVPRDNWENFGKTICLDTVGDTTGPWPNATWAWYTLTESYIPTWDGPHCFTISCCRGIRGNVDFDPSEQINTPDLTYLVDYLFRGGPQPPCEEEADLNGNGAINVADITYFVDYLFKDGDPPLPCPSFGATYEYTGYDSTGATIVQGSLHLLFGDLGQVTGTWQFEAVGEPESIGPQIGSGNLIGQVIQGEVWINLNPDYVDYNVWLFGTLQNGEYSGTWEYWGFPGLLNHGGFVAVEQ